MKCGILTIGDEILIGQVVDTNSAWIAGQLQTIGVSVVEILTIGDDANTILRYLKDFGSRFDLVITTGGLGPTSDDITVEVYARYFGTERQIHQPTLDHLVKLYQKFGLPLNEHSKEQALVPTNAEVLHNKMGTAPGLLFHENETFYTCLPGVPYEMKSLLKDEILPRIKHEVKNQIFAYRTLLTVGEGESKLAARLKPFENGLEEGVQLAYLPHFSMVRLRITVWGGNQEKVNQLLDQKTEELATLIPDILYGWDDDTLENVVGRLLKERGMMLGLAESCTGGLLAHRIVSIPGSSDYFSGSIVAYSNDIKVHQLGVSSETIDKYGAVSEQTVVEMATGVLEKMKTDAAISTSGIAGPGGGSAEKPVGTIWICVSLKNKVKTHKLQLTKDRLLNIEYTVIFALNMLRKLLTEG